MISLSAKAKNGNATYPFKLHEILADNQQICTLLSYSLVKNDYLIPLNEIFTATFKFAASVARWTVQVSVYIFY